MKKLTRDKVISVENKIYGDNTKVLDVILYVKKIVSLSPDSFDFISLELALERYHHYLFCVLDSGRKSSAKDFKEWLYTEI